jgi:hypothetical protein
MDKTIKAKPSVSRQSVVSDGRGDLHQLTVRGANPGYEPYSIAIFHGEAEGIFPFRPREIMCPLVEPIGGWRCRGKIRLSR